MAKNRGSTKETVLAVGLARIFRNFVAVSLRKASQSFLGLAVQMIKADTKS
jgi:hypothetical protein